MTHTPEPWHIKPHGIPEGLHGIIAPDYTKWFVAEDCKKADAARIVACVNACAGISTESLLEYTITDLSDIYTTAAKYDQLKQQNAALSEQVAGLVGAIDIWQENPTTGNGFALIDAATGGAMSIEDKWCWKMDYCKKKGIPAAQEWAWNEAEKALLAAIAKAGSHE